MSVWLPMVETPSSQLSITRARDVRLVLCHNCWNFTLISFFRVRGLCRISNLPPVSSVRLWHFDLLVNTSTYKSLDASLSLPTPLSTLLAVPIPSEHAGAGLAVQRAVEQAVRESVEQGIDKRGKEVTPWLLKRVGELTKGTALGLSGYFGN